MKKILVFENINNLNNKKDALEFLAFVKKYSRRSFEIIILPHILFLLFLKEKYSGKKIKFACSASFFSQKTLLTINSFSIRHFFLSDYSKFSKNPDSILRKNNIIIDLPIFTEDKQGRHFDEIRQEIIYIYNAFVKTRKTNFQTLFLVYNKKTKLHKEEMLSLERDILFIRKTIYDIFGSDLKKIKILYKVSFEEKDDFLELAFLDGLFITM